MIYDGSVTGGSVPAERCRCRSPSTRSQSAVRAGVDTLGRSPRRLVHRPPPLAAPPRWPCLVWSEMGVTQQMMDQPGYSYAQARDTHIRLLDHGLAVSTSALSVEFPFAGFVPSQLYVDLKQHLMASPERGRCILLANNLTDHTSPLLHGSRRLHGALPRRCNRRTRTTGRPSSRTRARCTPSTSRSTRLRSLAGRPTSSARRSRLRLGLAPVGLAAEARQPSSIRASNACTGCVAGPRRTAPSTSENTLPCAGHVTVGPAPSAFTTPRSNGAP